MFSLLAATYLWDPYVRNTPRNTPYVFVIFYESGTLGTQLYVPKN